MYSTHIHDMYICVLYIPTLHRIGGEFIDWTRALLARRWGIPRLFPSHTYLFWIRLTDTAQELERIMTYLSEDKLHVYISTVYSWRQQEVDAMFEAQKGRRAVGKLLLDFRHAEE